MAKKANTLKIENRDFSKKAKHLRAEGKIPASIYGPKFPPVSIQLETKPFKNLYKRDRSSIIELKNHHENYRVLIKNVQKDPNSFEFLNIEFYKIKADEKLKTSIPIELTGEAPAVKAGGILWNPITEIEIECFPEHIPDQIYVDISHLENYEDSISVGEIRYPEGVVPVSSLESVVIKINAPKSIETGESHSEEFNTLTRE